MRPHRNRPRVKEPEMMFGIVVEVRIERHDEAGEMLASIVVPMVKASPGFVKGYWLGSDDQSTGTSMLIFENEETAHYAADAMRAAPEGGPVAITRADVLPVIAQA
jgi:hypothetical protein